MSPVKYGLLHPNTQSTISMEDMEMFWMKKSFEQIFKNSKTEGGRTEQSGEGGLNLIESRRVASSEWLRVWLTAAGTASPSHT